MTRFSDIPDRTRSQEESDSEGNVMLKRTWRDLIELAFMYSGMGRIVPFDLRDKESFEKAAISFRALANTTTTGAKKCLKLMGLRSNEKAWTFLKENEMLPIMEDVTLTAKYTSIKRSGGTICLDLLEVFINGKDPQNHEERLQKRRKLDCIALECSRDARDEFVTIFFKIASVVSTLCSFIPDDFGTLDNRLPLHRRMFVVEKFSRYLSLTWKSPSMHLHYRTSRDDSFSRSHMVDGWNLTSEVLKIQMQELLFAKTRYLADGGESRTGLTITTRDVLRHSERMVNHVIAELTAWVFSFLRERDTKEGFLESVTNTLSEVAAKVLESIGEKDIKGLSMLAMDHALDQVSSGGPTMAEVRYHATVMKPERREARIRTHVIWDPKEVLQRCRWSKTRVFEKYPSIAMLPSVNNTVIPETPLVDAVPETPPPAPTVVDQDEQQSVGRKNVRSREEQEQPGLEVPRLKMLKLDHHVSRLSSENRAGHGAEKNTAAFDNNEEAEEDYVGDGDDSDGEAEHKDVSSPTHPDAALLDSETPSNFSDHLNQSIQNFYSQVLQWPVVPADPRAPEHESTHSAGNLLFGNMKWAEDYVKNFAKNVLPDVTTAKNLRKYRDHWKTIIPIELRGAVAEAVRARFRRLFEKPTGKWTDDIRQEEFLVVRVQKVSATRTLLNLTCLCTDHKLNRKIIEELQGGTLCLGYLEHKGIYSDLSLVACRRLCYSKNDIVMNGMEDRIEQVRLSIAISRRRFSNMTVGEGAILRLLHLCHFSPFMRMYKALEESFRIPVEIQRRLYGSVQVDLPFGDLSGLEMSVDEGCLKYLRNVRETTKMFDSSQYEASLSVLSNIGRCDPDSNSMSMIQGPPGTGKTSTILVICGALLHHSKVGHVGRNQPNALSGLIAKDNILRCSDNPDGIKILISCASNQGVDNILLRLKEEGIPDGSGGKLYPQFVRLGRENYSYGNYLNSIETEIVEETLREIFAICGDNGESLLNEVAVLSPYRSAVDHMADILARPGYMLSNKRIRDGVLIGTADAMQGSERDVVIVSAVRSNPLARIGFLSHLNRLNVTLSRARKLVVFICDMTTLTGADVEFFRKFYSSCVRQEEGSGSGVLVRTSTKHGRSTGYPKLWRLPR